NRKNPGATEAFIMTAQAGKVRGQKRGQAGTSPHGSRLPQLALELPTLVPAQIIGTALRKSIPVTADGIHCHEPIVHLRPMRPFLQPDVPEPMRMEGCIPLR